MTTKSASCSSFNLGFNRGTRHLPIVCILVPLNMFKTCLHGVTWHSLGSMFLLITLHVAPLSTWKRTGWPPTFIVAKIFDLKDELSRLLTYSSEPSRVRVKQYSSSLESCDSGEVPNWWMRSFLSSLGLGFSCLHTFARWFALPHFVHSFPNATHLPRDLSCFRPQYLHSTNFGLLLFLPLDPCFILWLGVFTSSLPLMAFICVAVVSADRQVSMQRCSVNLGVIFSRSRIANATHDPISN